MENPPEDNNAPDGVAPEVDAAIQAGNSKAALEWTPKRKLIRGMPRGLEYLTKLELPIVKKYLGDLPDEVVLPYEVARKFRIFDKFGKVVYYAFEEKGNCFNNICANRRMFTYHITDRDGITVFSIERNYHCCMGCMCLACTACCQDTLNVYSSEGETFGMVRHMWSVLKPTWMIEDDQRQPKYQLVGPLICCMCACCDATMQFKLKNFIPKTAPVKGKPQKIGSITRSLSGSKKLGGKSEDPNQVPAFGLQVPVDMDVKMKAVVISAAFLVNAQYYDTALPPPPPPGTPPPQAQATPAVPQYGSEVPDEEEEEAEASQASPTESAVDVPKGSLTGKKLSTTGNNEPTERKESAISSKQP